jgi:hypothetical protein
MGHQNITRFDAFERSLQQSSVAVGLTGQLVS